MWCSINYYFLTLDIFPHQEGKEARQGNIQSLPVLLWFPRICHHVEPVCMRNATWEWSPANDRGPMICRARLLLSFHRGSFIQRRAHWDGGLGPLNRYQDGTGLFSPVFPLTLNFTGTSVPDTRGYQAWVEMEATGLLISRRYNSRVPERQLCSLTTASVIQGMSTPEVQKN